MATLAQFVPPTVPAARELEPGEGVYRRPSLEIFPGYKLIEKGQSSDARGASASLLIWGHGAIVYGYQP